MVLDYTRRQMKTWRIMGWGTSRTVTWLRSPAMRQRARRLASNFVIRQCILYYCSENNPIIIRRVSLKNNVILLGNRIEEYPHVCIMLGGVGAATGGRDAAGAGKKTNRTAWNRVVNHPRRRGGAAAGSL